MARNREKAQSMLHRFRHTQQMELGKTPARLGGQSLQANKVAKLQDAERFRMQVVQELANTSLSEYQVRDLNDLINKLMRQKGYWANKVRELNGPDYLPGAKFAVESGLEAPGTSGYKYFGRARELPGVKELFEEAEAEKRAEEEYRKKSVKPSELYKRVDADYYGYRDEDDGRLLAYELQVGQQGKLDRHLLILERERVTREMKTAVLNKQLEIDTEDLNPVPPWAIPSQKEVEEWLVNRRKQALLEEYSKT